MSETSILTYKGNDFDYSDIENSYLDLEDIAHSLSLNCRFNGHCKSFYSVATHSCLVYRLMEYSMLRMGNPFNLTLTDLHYGLIHDTGESYFVDLPRPMKNFFLSSDEFRGFQEQYNKMEKILVERIFGGEVPELTEKKVKFFDTLALVIEAKYLMPEDPKYWGVWNVVKDNYFEPGFCQGMVLSDKPLSYWRDLFLQDYAEIKEKLSVEASSNFKATA